MHFVNKTLDTLTAKMDRSIAVLFRLGKALRYGDAEDFFQQYDALMEHENLSDYAVMLQLQLLISNTYMHKEAYSLRLLNDVYIQQ